jgi:hypothetical protein
MDQNVKLKLAKEYLRQRGKYILEQNKDDPNKFEPTTAVGTDVRKTMKEYMDGLAKNTTKSTQTIRLFDRNLRYKK